jgi:hypothetical protein
MNPVEPWFSIVQRQRLRIADMASEDHRRGKMGLFIEEWDQHAQPFNWSTPFAAKVVAAAPALAA